ncbi:hypothetical protein GQ651_11950 [Alphaproteobacteria bacterium GH1-50]|uniref:TraB family protein n=1 Tax=Kangsaoukella pontilimi TaxID=2691042 RepID=A0A7C9MWR5_9RHOB|nr:TraB/GumN family protein [Kangsaoukella pontilimi]MXQ08560.1 hypothetical protein [Kangsaoukella pontilimi]
MLRSVFLLISLLFPVVAAAQVCGTTDLTDSFTPEETARLDALVAPHAYSEGLTWEASRDDSRVVVVGTLHIPDARFDPIVERLSPVIEESDVLIVEATRESEAGLAQLAATRPEMFFLTSGPSLVDLLAPEEWAQLEAELATRGIPGIVAAKFQPWYASLILAVPTCALSVMQAGEVGLDRRLEAVAEAAGLEVAGLEGPEAVLQAFTGDSIDEQLEGLRITLGTTDPTNANTTTLVEMYFDGRTRASWEVSRILIDREGIANGQQMFDDIEETLLEGRNVAWEGILDDLIGGRDAVLAVGAAHLSGETGVLRALERAGYAVRPY